MVFTGYMITTYKVIPDGEIFCRRRIDIETLSLAVPRYRSDLDLRIVGVCRVDIGTMSLTADWYRIDVDLNICLSGIAAWHVYGYTRRYAWL